MSPQRTRLGSANGCLVLAGVALVAGCSSNVAGRPVAAPGVAVTEPSYPTSRPTAPAPPSHPTTPPAPAGTIPLPPDENGYVFIETKSGKTRCQIAADNVGCEAQFTNSPIIDGEHANGVSIAADGDVQWVLGNLGAIPTVTIDYRTYDAQGWTITATNAGTRFTNDRTGHGMFVSIDNVETY
jgi:hypothetical protein